MYQYWYIHQRWTNVVVFYLEITIIVLVGAVTILVLFAASCLSTTLQTWHHNNNNLHLIMLQMYVWIETREFNIPDMHSRSRKSIFEILTKYIVVKHKYVNRLNPPYAIHICLYPLTFIWHELLIRVRKAPGFILPWSLAKYVTKR